MVKSNDSRRILSRASKIFFLVLTTLLATLTAHAAAPVGQTIWIRASATGLFVSADQARGPWAPLVADRTVADAWEQFQVVDAGGGFIAFRSIGTGLFVSADQNRGAWAPLVADRPAIGTWEQFTWSDLAGGAFTLRGRATNRFVSADLARAPFAPLVSDRTVANTWEQFTWGAVGTQPAPGSPPGFSRLIWSDEFNGSTIDSANWGFDLGGGGWGNNELQNYTSRPENARVANGMLVIEARRENFGGNAFTSARLKTQGKQSFGINTWVEARINAPEGQGVWPAFWMLGNSITSVGWPSCGEIDIMEIQGQNPARNFGTILGLIRTDNTLRLAGSSTRRVRSRPASTRSRSRAPDPRSGGTSIAFSMLRQTSRTGSTARRSFRDRSSSFSTSRLAETSSARPTAAPCFHNRCRLIG